MKNNESIRENIDIWSGAGILGFLIAIIFLCFSMSELAKESLEWNNYLGYSIQTAILSALLFLIHYIKLILKNFNNKHLS